LPPAALQVLDCAKNPLPDRDADDVSGLSQFIGALGRPGSLPARNA
jgi:hypothetical protein